MITCGWLMVLPWLVLIAYWALAARATRRSGGGRWLWWREIAVRLGFFAVVVLALQLAVTHRVLPNAPGYALTTSAARCLSGVVLCALGIGLAILARACLERKGPVELVTTGPYAIVRHPIYSGMLLAMLGSAIGQSILWLLPLVVYGPRFISSARREEQLLLEQFPERYRAYMQQTRMLLPGVL